MSFDLNLSTVCNHKIYKELVPLNPDRRSLRPSKPIAAVGTVEVFASEDLIPKYKYAILDDPLTVDVYRPKMIQFRTKWQETEDYFTVSYVTLKTYCPKCVNRDVIDDLSYDIRGDFFVIRNEKLLLQNLEKFVVTEMGSNPFHNYIGTSLVTFLGQKVTDTGYITSKITGEVNNTVAKFKDMQEQYRQTGRAVTAGELLESLDSVTVTVDPQDPTIMSMSIVAKAVSGKTVEFEQVLKIA